jgi:hypothetical protein
MNDKLNRFTQQLGDNAPLAPDLENQTFTTTSEVRGPANGLRVGIALGVVAALAVGLVVANRDSSPKAVVAADELAAELAADGVATISKAVASVLPEGFKVSAVERPQEQTLNITAASTDGVVLLIKAALMGSDTSGASPPTSAPAPSIADGTEITMATMAPSSVRHQTVLTNPGDTIQNIADALSVSVSQLAEQYGWSETYVFDSSVYVGWVDPSTISDNCLIAPCVRYLGDRTTVESVAAEIGIPPQALASYNGFGLDHPVATMFPIVLPTIEETTSMTGATVRDVSDSTTPDSFNVKSPSEILVNSEGLSISIERLALDGLLIEDWLTRNIHDALLSLDDREFSLQSIFDTIPLAPIDQTNISFTPGETLGTLGPWYGQSRGAISFLFAGPTAMLIELPATAIADKVSTDENGIIVAIRSNETKTCIVWLVDAQSIGATEADVAAMATEGLSLAPSELGIADTTTAVSIPLASEAPAITEAPVDTDPPAESPTSTTQTP